MFNDQTARLRRWICGGILAAALVITTGCAHTRWGAGRCESCGESACEGSCAPGSAECEVCESGRKQRRSGKCKDCNECNECGGCRGKACSALCNLEMRLFGWMCHPSNAVPDTLPLGSTVRAHYQVMETNAEAADFIFHRHDFVGKSVQLTPDARDKAPEIAARMRMQPFPVLIERSENNSDPGLDQQRRAFVAQILQELGAPDADRRTIVAPSYGRGYNAIRAEGMYYQFLNQGSGNGIGYGNGYGGYGGMGTSFGGGTYGF